MKMDPVVAQHHSLRLMTFLICSYLQIYNLTYSVRSDLFRLYTLIDQTCKKAVRRERHDE